MNATFKCKRVICEEGLTNPKRIGRASYACAKCGRDVSMEYFFLQAIETTQENNSQQGINSK